VFRNNEKQYVVVNSFNTASSIEDSTQWTDSVVTETVESTEKSTDETIATSETVKATENTSTSITTSTTIITTTTTTPEKLPQTGQLWWPVPVLALAGLVLMGIGFKLRTKE